MYTFVETNGCETYSKYEKSYLPDEDNWLKAFMHHVGNVVEATVRVHFGDLSVFGDISKREQLRNYFALHYQRRADFIKNNLKCHGNEFNTLEGVKAYSQEVSDKYFEMLEEDIKLVAILCPVEVDVYDESGNLVGTISKTQNTIENNSNVFAYRNEAFDANIIVYDAGYSIKIRGTDEGTMKVFGSYCSNNDIQNAIAYVNVPISNDFVADFDIDIDNDTLTDNNSKLLTIKINNIDIIDFDKSITQYFADIDTDTAEIPTVTATPSNANAAVSIEQATSLIGTEAERTATVTVTAEDGITQTVYTVTFNLESHTHTIENGYTSDETGHWKNCSACDDKVDFSPHIEDSGMITTEPTEATEGVKTFKCTVCEHIIRTETVSKLEHIHNLEIEYSKDETGHWYVCSGCDKDVNFSTHTYDSGIITIPPTENAEGIKTYTCTECRYELIITLAKSDHTHNLNSFYSSDKSGHWYGCLGCSERNDFAAHIEDSGIITTEPTEEMEGIKTYKCIVCGYVTRTERISKLEHIHTLAIEYSFNATGHWFACSSCDEKVNFSTHNEESVVTTIEPTEISAGIKTFKCSVCGYVTRTENISAVTPNHTHSFDNHWKSDNTSHWHECNCGVTSDVANHISDSGKVTVQPTATLGGIRTYSCSVCGYLMNTETIPATGNNNSPSSPTYPSVTPSTTVIPTNSTTSTTFNVKVENRVTGENGKVKATRTGENVTINLGKDNNGYYANAYTSDGKVFEAVRITSGKAKFTIQSDIDFYIVIDKNSHLEYEDVSSGAGATDSGSPIDVASPVTNGVCIPQAELPRGFRVSNKKRRYRILKKRRLDDLVFVF